VPAKPSTAAGAATWPPFLQCGAAIAGSYQRQPLYRKYLFSLFN
jgi:hypothetical protein